ncbi:MAG TPA: hypothetical protein ACFYEF_06850 [Candidatus Wunengus sp. YC63]
MSFVNCGLAYLPVVVITDSQGNWKMDKFTDRLKIVEEALIQK